ncbi:beta strand repeat-containing protein [Halomonas sp. V046]|uniref:beta strand repeat-containing protein n=1 Tax=Halomonas sp. V046 TaxID=3459611 RepID=UPI004044E233
MNESDIDALQTNTATLTEGAVVYDRDGGGVLTPGSVTLLGDGAGGGTTIGNLAEGTLSGTSREAVTGSQLFTTNQNVSSLDTRVTTSEGDITTLGGRVTTAETGITSLDGRVTTNEGGITSLGGRVTTAETGITTLDGRVTTNEGGITTLGGRVTTNEGGITTLDGRVTTNEGGITSLGGRVTTNEGGITSLDGRVTTAETGITTLDGRVTVNEGDIDALQTNTATLTEGAVVYDRDGGGVLTPGSVTLLGDGAGGGTTIGNLAEGTLSGTSREAVTGSQLFTTNQNVSSLDTRVTTSEGDITVLGGRVTTNEGGITSLGGRVTTNESGITTLDGRVTTNEGGITTLGGRVTVNESDIDALQTNTATLTEGAVVYDRDGGGVLTPGSVTLLGDGAGGGTTIGNLAEGTLSGTSREAVNGSQLFTTNQNVSSLDTRVTTSEGDITVLGGRVTTAETGITSLDGRVTTNEGGITSLGGRVTTAETGITTLDGRVTTNEGGITTLDGRVTTAETGITTLDGRVTTNETGITTLDGRVTVNEGDIDALQTNTATLNEGAVVYDRDGGGVLTPGSVTLLGDGAGGGTTLGNLAEGTLSGTSREAVTGSQLFTTNQNVSSLDTRVTTSEGDITALGGRVTTNEGGITTLDGRVTTNEGGITSLGGRVTTAETGITTLDGRVTTNESGITTLGGRVTVNEGDIDTLQTNTATLTEGAVVYDRDGGGVLTPGSVTLLGDGAGGGTTIGNLAEGTLSGTSREAVTGSQLFTTNQNVSSLDTRVTTNEGGISTLGGRVTTAETGITSLDGRVTTNEGGITSLDGRVTTAETGITTLDGRVTVNEGDIDTLQTNTATLTEGAVVYDRDGGGVLTPGSVTLLGDGAGGGTTIGNLAEGTLSGTSREAVNGSQLFATNQALGSLTVTANQGWNLQANGDTATQIGPGDTLELLDGDNIALSRSGSQITIGTNSALSAQSLAISAGPTLSAAGIDMNGDRLSSLGGPLAAGDAVNLGYFDANRQHYFSVNDGGVQGANYANTGASGLEALAVGVGASSIAERGVALGAQTAVGVDAGVALGSGSVSSRALAPASGTIGSGSGAISFDTTDRQLLGAISLGSDTSYRQLTNVADGSAELDAVNVRQLQGAIASLSVTGQQYFHANSGLPDSLATGINAIAVGPGTSVNGNDGLGIGREAIVDTTAPGGVAIGAMARARMADAVALGSQADAGGVESIAVGAVAAATGARSVALGAGASATGAGSVAFGAGAMASVDASVALGNGASTSAVVATSGMLLAGQSVSFAGSSPVGTVAIGSPGAERTLTHLAAGRVSASSTDAINGSQLFTVTEAVNEVEGRVTSIEGDLTLSTVPDEQIVTYAATGGGVDYDRIELSGTNGTLIANLASGSISSTSADAVNGSQLWAIQDQLSNLQVSGAGSAYFSSNSSASAATASGIESLAVGGASVASGARSTALGLGASASVGDGVALGSGAIADRAGMSGQQEAFTQQRVESTRGALSIGSKGGERQITHVAGGTQGTDAVNVRQLSAVQSASVNYDRSPGGRVNYGAVTFGNGARPTLLRNVAPGVSATDAVNVAQLGALDRRYQRSFKDVNNRIDDVEEKASAGIAAVAAMGDAPYVPGRLTYHVGTGYHNGETALGISFRRTAESGRWSIDLGVGGSDAGATVGLGVSGVLF